MKNGNGKHKGPTSPPWMRDGRPDLWVRSKDFAQIMQRTITTVNRWVIDGTLREFGYSYYRDLSGFLYIKISEADRLGLDKVKAHARHAQRTQNTA